MYSNDKIISLMKEPPQFAIENESSFGYLVYKANTSRLELTEEVKAELRKTSIGSASLDELKEDNQSITITISDLESGNYTKDSVLDKNIALSEDYLNSKVDFIISIIGGDKLSYGDLKHSFYEVVFESLVKLPFEDFLGIDSKLFISNPSLLSSKRQHSRDEQYKKLYKHSYIENAKKEDYNLTPSNLPFYYFEKHDLPFLEELLVNQKSAPKYFNNDITYDKLSRKVQGFSNLISIEDYVLNWSPSEIYSLNEDSFNKKFETIRANFKEYYLTKDSGGRNVFDLHTIANNEKVEPERLKRVLDVDFLKEYLTGKKYSRIGFRLNGTNPRNVFLENCSNIFVNLLNLPNEQLFNLDPYEVISTSDEILDHLNDPDNKNIKAKYAKEIKSKSFEYIIKSLNYASDSKNLSFLLGEVKYYLEENTDEKIAEIVKKVSPSVNLFIIFSDFLSNNFEKQGLKEKELFEKVSVLWQGLYLTLKSSHLSEINLITNKYRLNDLVRTENIVGSPTFKEKENQSNNNILEWNNLGIDNVDERALSVLCFLDPSAYIEVLDKKILSNVTFADDFLYSSLNSKQINTKESEENLAFVKNYIKKHKGLIENDPTLLKQILTNKHQSFIYPYISDTVQNKHFKNLLELIKEKESIENDLDLIAKKYPNENDRFTNSSKSDTPVSIDPQIDSYENLKYDDIEKIYGFLTFQSKENLEEIQKTYGLFTSSYLENKVYELAKSQDFKTVKEILNNNRSIIKRDSLIEAINGFKASEILTLSADNDFREIVLENVNYDGTSSLIFPKLNTKEIETVINNFSTSEKKESIKYYSILRKSEDSLREYLIKNKPEQIMNNLSFLMHRIEGKNYYFSKEIEPLITRQYTIEEVFSLFDSLKEQDKFFKHYDVNAKNTDNYEEIMAGNSTKEDVSNKFKNILEHFKNENHIAYLLMLTDHSLVDTYLGKDIKGETRDERYHRSFVKIADIDVLVESLKDITDKYNSNRWVGDNYQYNPKLLVRAIRDITYPTYFEKDYNKSEYDSLLSESDSQKIVNTLFEKCPLLTITEIRNVGKIDSIVDYICENIDTIYTKEIFKELLTPTAMEPVGIGAKYKEERYLKVFNAFIEEAMRREDIETLEYVKYLLELEYSTYYGKNIGDFINSDKANSLLSNVNHEGLCTLIDERDNIQLIEKTIEIIKLNKELNNNKTTNRKMKI